MNSHLTGCKKCEETGWLCPVIPFWCEEAKTFFRRQRAIPCHWCNAHDWRGWALFKPQPAPLY